MNKLINQPPVNPNTVLIKYAIDDVTKPRPLPSIPICITSLYIFAFRGLSIGIFLELSNP